MSPNNRNNGLSADRWAPLVDLEPQFADALLEALREEGVAAYASPAPGVRGPYMDIQLPNIPTDRVWVDAGATAAAREVLDARRGEFGHAEPPEPPEPSEPSELSGRPEPSKTAGEPSHTESTHTESTHTEVTHTEVTHTESTHTESTPTGPTSTEPARAEPDDQDIEAAFRAIVAGYGSTGTEQVAPWSPAEDVENDTPNAGGSWRVLRRAESEDGGDTDGDWGLQQGPEPDLPEPPEREEHYVPPPPPPLPRMDKQTKLSWAGVIGGPILLILFTALDWSPIPYATFFAVAAFIGGFASLVYRMKDDGPDIGDDGAVV